MNSFFRNKKILITAGPTYEPIDPVRFIGNRSSGKMGYAIASELAERGAEVILVSGPVQISIEHSNIELIKVSTAEEMFNMCQKYFHQTDIAILAAAVADYKPVNVFTSKMKKTDNHMTIELEKTKDILFSLGQVKSENQLLIGFSLETDNELENSRKKLFGKNCDFIVMNSLREKGASFGTDTNKITILDKSGSIVDFPVKNKTEVASDICNYIISYFEKMNNS